MTDNVNRKIDYLRVSVTERCNLRCQYCMPENGISKVSHDDILSIEELTWVIETALEMGISKVRLTGGEPLLRKGILSLIENISGNPLLKDLSLTTNGVLLCEMAEDLKSAGLHRLNISLDTLDPEKYTQITRGGDIQTVLNGINKVRKLGMFPIKVNTVLIGGFNDKDVHALARLVTEGLVDELRFIELMQIGETANWTKSNFVSNDTIIEALELTLSDTQNIHSPTQMYDMPQGGKIGLINPISHKFCKYCNRIRLTADGKLKPCLLDDTEVDVKAALRDGADIQTCIAQAVHLKPESHNLDNELAKPITRNMVRIGG